MPNAQIPMSTRLSIRDYSVPAAYVLTHKATDKQYVGSTVNAYKRISEHRSHLKAGTHRNKNLQTAYDEDPHFVLDVIFSSNKEEAIETEQRLLDEGRTRNDLLNIATDARASGTGRVVPDGERSSQSKRAAARMNDPVHKAKMVEANETPVVIDGVQYPSITEAAIKLGVKRNVLYTRMWRQRKSTVSC